MQRMAPILLALSLLGAGTGAHAAEGDTVPVGTTPAERRPIAQALEFVGRAEAPERVEIRARVKGMLDAVLFKEGDTVAEGAPLYRIEKSLFEADVEGAQGSLERSRAMLSLAGIQRQRAEDLLARNAGTVVARDQAVANEAQARGAVLSDEAALQTARINLGYTDITSPIAGRIGRTSVTRGNIVGPDSGVLAVVVSQNPMHITFPVSQREFLEAQKAGRSSDLSSLQVQVRFSDGSLYDQVGRVSFVDVSVERTTDTLTLRADIPNPNGRLIDGQLLRVSVQAGAPQERVLVPQAALIADQEGIYVFVVEDGKAAIRRVKTVGESGSNAIIESGLSGGEQVIVEGIQTLRPGTPVLAHPVAGLSSGG